MAVPPPSQPRRGSTAPTVDRCLAREPVFQKACTAQCGSRRASARPRKRWVRHQRCPQCRRLRSLAGARQLPQLIGARRGSRYSRKHARTVWEPSSFSEAAMTVGQAPEMPAMPPPSQPRRGSTAPTVDRCLARAPVFQKACTAQCGSRRASARPRWRWVRRLKCWQCRRLRSLAGARQLPQLIGAWRGSRYSRKHARHSVGAVELQRGRDGGGSGT